MGYLDETGLIHLWENIQTLVGHAYSSIKTVGSSYSFVSNDIGKTFMSSTLNGALTLTLTKAVSSTMPVGAEIAVVKNSISTTGQYTIVGSGGVRFALTGDSTIYTNKAIRISLSYGMAAMKKLYSDSTNGDLWLITGNVEVVP